MVKKPKLSLAETHPDLAVQADGWDPKSATRGSDKKRSWKCGQGHRWSASILSRTSGTGCPVCSGRTSLVGVNDLATTHPELAAQADGWDPRMVKARSGKKVQWKCEFGHSWTAIIANRSKGIGCPICSAYTVQIGVNDLATTHPELAAQADGWDPSITTRVKGKKVQWKCEFGHKWQTTVNSRIGGTGCPVCSGNVALTGFNDLATTHPELAAQADGWDPRTLSAGSNRRVRWKCALGHHWEAPPGRRVKGINCPVCSNQIVQFGFNDLATTHPELAAQADGWDPRTLSSGANKKRQWKCEFGHKWTALVSSRARGNGCGVCSNKVLLNGFNDLATTHPELAAQADGWDPRTLSSGANKKRQWKCEFGHKWTAVVYSRANGNGCPSCAKYGFKPSENAWIYLIENTTLRLLQIGITNNPEERMSKHRRSGFDVVLDLRGPLDGYLARDLERACLNAFKKRSAKFVREIDMATFDGSTESWSRGSLNVKSISQALNWVYEDEAR
jgi:hypothetical protein